MTEYFSMQQTLTAVALCAAVSGCAALNSGDYAVPGQARQDTTQKKPLQDAEAQCRALLRNEPPQAEPWFLLGNLYAESGRLDEAERAYQEAVRRGAEPKALHNLGLVQIRLGIANVKRARQQLPANSALHRETRQYLKTLLETGL
jgi:pentatricopeptide repeat protein